MTATVETVQEQLDMAAICPAEKVVPAIARSVTLNETDTGQFLTYFCSFTNQNLKYFLF